MAIVEQDCYGLFEPSRSNDKVNRVIPIDITCREHEATKGRDNSNGLRPGGGELKSNPIIGAGAFACSGLDAGQIWTMVPVEIRDHEGEAGPGGCERRAVNILAGGWAGDKQAK